MNESNPSDQSLAELLTLTMKVDKWGNIRYRNRLGQMHRIHGPALIWADGARYWYQGDLLHRTDGPSMVWSDGTEFWYLYDEILYEREYHERIRSLSPGQSHCDQNVL